MTYTPAELATRTRRVYLPASAIEKLDHGTILVDPVTPFHVERCGEHERYDWDWVVIGLHRGEGWIDIEDWRQS